MSTVSSTGGPVLQASGIGSGLDVAGIVSKLVAAEINPLQQQLTAQQTTLNSEVSAFGTLSSSLDSLESALSSLMDSTAFQQKTATSSDTTVATASVDTTASQATYALTVNQLAQQENIHSNATGITDTSTAVAYGSLQIDVGTVSGSTFTSSSTSTVTISSSADSLADIRDQINAQATGVTASIINDGTNNYLSVISNSTGAANAVRITVTSDSDGTLTDNSGLSQFAFDPSGTATSNMTEYQAAQDASFTLNGIASTSSSNTVTGAVQGLSLVLAGNGTSTITVGADTSATKDTITSFVNAYNNVITTINTLSKYNKGGTNGPLLSDSMVAGLKTRLQNIMGGSSSNSGVYSTLTQLGYATNTDDGTLYLKNSSDLDNALSSNFNDVGTMMADYATQVDTLVSSYTGSLGLIHGRTDSLNTMLSDLQDQQDQLTLRQQSLTDTYTKQYSALDGMIAQMNSTMSYLSQQLSKLPG